jgi:hypothetical protein
MTYATTNPPQLVMSPIGGVGAQLWSYRSTDDAATVNSAGYITNGTEIGMREGDLVMVVDTDAGPPITGILMVVNSVSTTYPGAVDLQDTTAATTDTD